MGCLDLGHSPSEPGLEGSKRAGLAGGVAGGGLLGEGAVAAAGTSSSCFCKALGENNSSESEGSDGQSMSAVGRSHGLATGCSKGPTAEAMVAREWDMAWISWVMDTRCLFALC